MAATFNERSMQGCLGIVGFVVAGFSLVLLVVMFLQAPSGGITGDPGTAGGLICTAVTMVAAAFMGWYGYKASREEAPDDETAAENAENAILAVVREHDGRVTVSTLADGTDLGTDVAEEVLNRLAEDDYIRTETDSDGDEFYVFPGLDDADESFDENELLAKLGSIRILNESDDGESDDETAPPDRDE